MFWCAGVVCGGALGDGGLGGGDDACGCVSTTIFPTFDGYDSIGIQCCGPPPLAVAMVVAEVCMLDLMVVAAACDIAGVIVLSVVV